MPEFAVNRTPDGVVADLDESALDTLRDIMAEEFPALVRAYLDEASRLIESMALAAACRDADRMRRAAHSLKSASANIGALGLAEVARQLEGQGRAGEFDGADDRIDSAKSIFQRVKARLAALAAG